MEVPVAAARKFESVLRLELGRMQTNSQVDQLRRDNAWRSSYKELECHAETRDAIQCRGRAGCLGKDINRSNWHSVTNEVATHHHSKYVLENN